MKIPRIGETWEIKIPGKPKKIKVLADIYRRWKRSDKTDRGLVTPVISYLRKNKGRHTGVAPRTLLKYGRLIKERPRCEECGEYPKTYHDGFLLCKNGHTVYLSCKSPNNGMNQTKPSGAA